MAIHSKRKETENSTVKKRTEGKDRRSRRTEREKIKNSEGEEVQDNAKKEVAERDYKRTKKPWVD
jgi:hypothetical protein